MTTEYAVALVDVVGRLEGGIEQGETREESEAAMSQGAGGVDGRGQGYCEGIPRKPSEF